MKTKVIALAILAGSSIFAQPRFSVGVQVGGYSQGYYEPASVYDSRIPPCPGPDYNWVDGYWSQDYGQRNWIAGYWNRPVYVEPRYVNRYYENYGYNNDSRYYNNYNNRSYRGRNDFNERREYQNRRFEGSRGRDDHQNRGNDRYFRQDQNRGNGNRR